MSKIFVSYEAIKSNGKKFLGNDEVFYPEISGMDDIRQIEIQLLDSFKPQIRAIDHIAVTDITILNWKHFE